MKLNKEIIDKIKLPTKIFTMNDEYLIFNFKEFNNFHHNLIDNNLTNGKELNKLILKKENNYSLKEFVEMLDHFFMHFIEEIYEFQEAYYYFRVPPVSKKDKYDTIEELGDILFYCDSIYSYINNALKALNINKKFNITFTLSIDEINKTVISDDNMKNCLFIIIQNIVSCRRLFPQRKWHKEYTETIENNILLLERSLELLKSLIQNYLYCVFILIKQSENNIDINTINKIFLMKLIKSIGIKEFKQVCEEYNKDDWYEISYKLFNEFK